ncbi:hypothetical protein DBR40_05350 [Pedobacter sp. KBW01]|uniref:hypothetical protein n=1 Tax=Pedobacter sp. KBW01 TaxID=2153364 RepID=UPI000F590C40|nr:hypothetical protein [Pedobacter sp. KBW01]RQO79147.1 hypothetical protein DBR40_05350 [Pedobacter sp. KBW01]
MEKLTLEQLAPYLPYGLKMFTPVWVRNITELTTFNFDLVTSFYNTRAILRPMSDLTKQIDQLGFTPLIELLRLLESNHFSKDKVLVSCCKDFTPKVIDCFSKTYSEKHTEHIVKQLISTSNMGDLIYSFGYSEHFNRFQKRDETREITLGTGHQLHLFQKLYEWHFDVFGLIEQGLAISIHDAKEVTP